MSSSIYRRSADRDADSAASAGIGALRSTHRPDVRARVRRAAIPLVLGLVLFIFPLFRSETGIVIVGLGACIFIAALVDGFIFSRSTFVELHERGLAVTRFDRRTEVAFEDVDEVYWDLEEVRTLQGPRPLVEAVRLVTFDRARVYVPLSVEGGLTLLRRIDREVTDVLIPEALHAFATGERLTFGKIEIDKTRIRVGPSEATWQDLQLVRIGPRHVELFAKSWVMAWERIDLSTVPHPQLFLRLLRGAAKKLDIEKGALID